MDEKYPLESFNEFFKKIGLYTLLFIFVSCLFLTTTVYGEESFDIDFDNTELNNKYIDNYSNFEHYIIANRNWGGDNITYLVLYDGSANFRRDSPLHATSINVSDSNFIVYKFNHYGTYTGRHTYSNSISGSYTNISFNNYIGSDIDVIGYQYIDGKAVYSTFFQKPVKLEEMAKVLPEMIVKQTMTILPFSLLFLILGIGLTMLLMLPKIFLR